FDFFLMPRKSVNLFQFKSERKAIKTINSISSLVDTINMPNSYGLVATAILLSIPKDQNIESFYIKTTKDSINGEILSPSERKYTILYNEVND
ncbi:MAG: hypothetical protein LIO90_02000, partial [Bacteroidales bacterium]|nr:hypothetical protein [Bacteroidales bacterium]